MGKDCMECIYFTKDKPATLIGWWGWCGVRNAKTKSTEGKYCKNFEERHYGCFLTTACVQYFGKPDDCFELTTLRAFRDNVMKKNQEWNLLVEEYYQIAPCIVEKIDMLENKADIYTDIYQQIQEIIPLIQEGQNEAAVQKYANMVTKYKKML